MNPVVGVMCDVCKVEMIWRYVNFIQSGDSIIHLCDSCCHRHETYINKECKRLREK